VSSFERVLLKNVGKPDSQSIETYVRSGGYEALKKALKDFTPQAVADEVLKSGLRGRGGAGFPTGRKWGFIPKQPKLPVYLLCNADESEPGTFKDRQIIDNDPHMLIEGIVISCYAIGAHSSYIYIRGEFFDGAKILEKAIAQAYQKGFLGKNILKSGFDLDLHVFRGAGAYICGEETALMESIEGKRGYPRIRPPFPAVQGLFKGPTIINNVETLACVPHIIGRGAGWFASIGTGKSTGPKLYSVSGHVNKPGVYELPIGVPFKELLNEHCGGILGGRNLKAFIPGGSSVPVLTADKVDVRMDFESLAEAGSMLGSGGVIVMNDTVCMVRAAWNLAHFYAHESCGQCTPCREGTFWLEKILDRIENGTGRDGDADLILELCDTIEFNTICPLGDAAVGPARSFTQRFRSEFDYHITHKKCTVG
jgi:NADH-quinone oxidoreductase subunit F